MYQNPLADLVIVKLLVGKFSKKLILVEKTKTVYNYLTGYVSIPKSPNLGMQKSKFIKFTDSQNK